MPSSQTNMSSGSVNKRLLEFSSYMGKSFSVCVMPPPVRIGRVDINSDCFNRSVSYERVIFQWRSRPHNVVLQPVSHASSEAIQIRFKKACLQCFLMTGERECSSLLTASPIKEALGVNKRRKELSSEIVLPFILSFLSSFWLLNAAV